MCGEHGVHGVAVFAEAAPPREFRDKAQDDIENPGPIRLIKMLRGAAGQAAVVLHRGNDAEGSRDCVVEGSFGRTDGIVGQGEPSSVPTCGNPI